MQPSNRAWVARGEGREGIAGRSPHCNGGLSSEPDSLLASSSEQQGGEDVGG